MSPGNQACEATGAIVYSRKLIWGNMKVIHWQNDHIVGKVRNIPASAPNETLFTAVRVIIGSLHSELHRAVVADDCNCAAEVPDQSIWKTKVQ